MANRNFLWVTSVLKDLRGCLEDQVPGRLKKVPANMADSYEKALSMVKVDNEDRMRLILMWLLRYQRTDMPLTQEELAVVAGLSDPSNVTQICTNALVKLTKRTRKTPNGDDVDDNFVEFVQFSAKEHLESLLGNRQELKIPWFDFSDEEAHYEIAIRCLQVFEDQPKQAVLLDYAANFWFKHYLLLVDKTRISKDKAAEETTIEGKAAREMLEKVTQLNKKLVGGLFKPGRTAFGSWLDCFSPDMGFKSLSAFDMEETQSEDQGEIIRADPVYYAVKLELFDVAKQLITGGAPYIKPGKEGNVLQLALYRNEAKYLEVADVLLDLPNIDKAAVTARDGPHGTPLYIASAHGIRDMVERLLQKDATAHRIEDGKYGSALHAAAFYGHTDIARLLLETGKAQVDQRGHSFGTALQVAASQGRVGVVELLLTTYRADPKITAGHLETALQAALTRTSDGYKDSNSNLIVAALKKAGVEFRESSTDADWRSAYVRVRRSSQVFFKQYINIFQMPKGGGLSQQQALLAPALQMWNLPTTQDLDQFLRSMDNIYPYKVALQETLEEIKRALPTFDETHAYELSRENFLYKALFWSGIEYILQRLAPLVLHGIVSIGDIIEQRGLHSQRKYLELELELSSFFGGFSQTPSWFRFLSRLPPLDFFHKTTSLGLPWSDEDTEFIWMRFGRWQDDLRRYARDQRNLDLDMDTSDKITLEILKQREREQQRPGQHGEDTAEDSRGERGKGRMRRREERSPSPAGKLTDTAVMVKGGGADEGVSDGFEGEGGGPGADTPIHLVVEDLLSLVTDLVQFGKQCDRLHDAVQKPPRRGSSSSSSSRQTQAAIREVTFEVFAAVARLAVALSSSQSPEQTVLLLTTVRLPRITKLAAACEQQMMADGMAGSSLSSTANTNTNTNTEQLVDDVAAALIDRLKGLLGRQTTQAATNSHSSTHDLNNFSLSSEFQDQIRDAVRYEVKLQVHGTETTSLRESSTRWGGWPWSSK